MLFPELNPPSSDPHVCPDCGTFFASLQKMAVHRNRRHKYTHPLHAYVCFTVCPICLLQFHNRTRLLNHLKYRSSVCLANVLINGPILSEVEARQLDEDERSENRELYSKGLRPHTAIKPVYRMCGPLPPFVEAHNCEVSRTHNCHVLGYGRRHFG